MSFKINFENNIKKNEVDPKINLVLKKFNDWALRKSINLGDLNTEELIKKTLLENRLLIPGVTADEVFNEMKKSGFINIEKEKVDSIKNIEHIDIKIDSLKGIKEVKDESILKQLELNHFFEELDKDLFRNNYLDIVYDKSLSLVSKERIENIDNIDYYNEFADAGLLKKGRVEALADFESKEERKNGFKKETDLLSDESRKNIDKNKKIATILERGIAYGISSLKWYGENIHLQKSSEFDDIKRGVDEIFEVSKEGEDSNFMGLGIDVTYRGLYSESYKEKLFGLLSSIKNGYKTKIKYFKGYNGEKRREFDVPKIILYFNIEDVKDMVNFIKNIDDPIIKEEFKNSPQKITVMNQMIIQCEVLANFSEKYQNTIFRKYFDVLNSIKELAWDNKEIKNMLENRHEDDVLKHMKFLIDEFNLINK